MNKREIMSASLEKYLAAIYTISQADRKIRITDIANEMSVSKPSANRAVGVLKKLGLVEHKPYSSIILTEKGKKLAESVEDRNDLLKNFFEVVLGVGSDTAQKQAEIIEPVIEKEVFEKLGAFMVNYFSGK